MFRSENISLKPFTTIGVGGCADYLIEAYNLGELTDAIHFAKAKQLPYHILGKGSNTLFHDDGYRGVVILNKCQKIEWKLPFIEVEAGFSFSLLGIQTAKKGWSGLEFAAGIPASVGGAIYMNAGACGSETANPLRQVRFLEEDGSLKTYLKTEVEFSYRYSSFQKKKGVIVSALFEVAQDPGAKERQRNILEYRTRTQPYSDPSAGCIFRNPQGASAGALIEASGLKGASVGGASVSHLHANFIVNRNGASRADILKLAKHVQETVYEKSGYQLEMEVRAIDYE